MDININMAENNGKSKETTERYTGTYLTITTGFTSYAFNK